LTGCPQQTAGDCFEPDVRVRLFGSRTDDAREGADIDLFIETRLQAPGQIALWSWPAGECLPEVMVVARHDSLAGKLLQIQKSLTLVGASLLANVLLR
jgi:hypothetical protein